jgi:hypothetical protein
MTTPSLIQRTVIVIAGVGFLAFGVWLLVDPAKLFALTGAGPAPKAILPELRAFYGGLEIGLGLYLLATLRGAQRWREGLLLAGIAYGAIALGRIVGMVVDRDFSAYLWIALAIELALAIAAFSVRRRLAPD